MNCKRCQLVERLLDQLLMQLEGQYEIAPTMRLGQMIQAYAWDLQKLSDRIRKIPEGTQVDFPSPPPLALFESAAEKLEESIFALLGDSKIDEPDSYESFQHLDSIREIVKQGCPIKGEEHARKSI